MKRGKIAALVLAAGFSSRMGAFKPLLPLGGSTPLAITADRFREAGIEDIRVVTGHMADRLAPVLAGLSVKSIFNVDYRRGMLSSVISGVNSFGPEIGAFFLLPVDVPLIKAHTVKSLLQAYEKSDAEIVYPRFLGLRGHPPLISSALPIRELDPDTPGGLRAFLEKYDEKALDVDVTDQGTTLDFDTPEDYRRLRAYAEREDIPTGAECRAFHLLHFVPRNVIVHCRVVAGLARTMAALLRLSGSDVDVEAAAAGGLLHDIARERPNHAAAGADILREAGYLRVADIVENHMDLRDGYRTLEAELVYLADKCVAEDRLVSIEERFLEALAKRAGKPGAVEAIDRRRHEAERIAAFVEQQCGIGVRQVIEKFEKEIRGAASPAKKTIYLVRHGAIRLPGPGKHFIGQTDLPLSPEGVRQAEELRERFRDVPLTAVWCSDLGRSIETARIIAGPHGFYPTVRKDLREIDLGEWDGMPFEAVRRDCPERFEERGRDIVRFRPPGGESFFDCAMRVLPVFYEAAHSAQPHIVVVGHAGVNRIILSMVLGTPLQRLFEIRRNYASVSKICRDESGFTLESPIESENPGKEPA